MFKDQIRALADDPALKGSFATTCGAYAAQYQELIRRNEGPGLVTQNPTAICISV